MYLLNLCMNILRLFFFFFIAFWLCLQVHVICHPLRFLPMISGSRGCGVWGESRVTEAHHSRNWNGNFLIQEDDLCSHRTPRPYWMINMEKIVPSNTLWCVHGVHLHWSVHFLFFLLFLPVSYFYSTSLRQGSDMLIVKIIFLHPECAELDKDGCAVRASW